VIDRPAYDPADLVDKVIDLRAAMCAVLNEREQRIVVEHFGLDGHGVRTLAEIAQTIGLSPARIQVLEETAIRKIRGFFWRSNRSVR
jgi:DNA-directed RNA polymerase sigma subunit (sigma70/sigma32)